MTGYRIKQTVFMLCGLLAGLWAGDFFWHACARGEAERIIASQGSQSNQANVNDVTKQVEQVWSEYTATNMGRYIWCYGCCCFFGLMIGGFVAGATGGASDKQSGGTSNNQ